MSGEELRLPSPPHPSMHPSVLPLPSHPLVTARPSPQRVWLHDPLSLRNVLSCAARPRCCRLHLVICKART